MKKKKVDKFYFNENGVELAVDIFFQKDTTGYGTTGFSIEFPELNILIKCPSFQELETAATIEFREKTSIKWKDILYIQLKYSPWTARDNGYLEVDFSFKATERQTGQNSRNENFFRERGGRAYKGKLQTGSYTDRTNAGKPTFYMNSIVSDTQENRKSLSLIYESFSSIFNQVNETFSPENIENILKQKFQLLLEGGETKLLTK